MHTYIRDIHNVWYMYVCMYVCMYVRTYVCMQAYVEAGHHLLCISLRLVCCKLAFVFKYFLYAFILLINKS